MGFVSRLASHISPAAVAPAFGIFSATRSSLLYHWLILHTPSFCGGLCLGISPPVGSSLMPAGHCGGHWTLPLTGCPFELGVTFWDFLALEPRLHPFLRPACFTCYWHCLSSPPPYYGGSRLAASLLSLFGRNQYFHPTCLGVLTPAASLRCYYS